VRAVKHLLPLFALCLLAACSSSSRRDVWAPAQPMKTSDPNATRRDLYSPMKTSGQYTSALENGGWKQYGKTVDEEMKERRENAKFERSFEKTPAVTPSEPQPKPAPAPAPAPVAPSGQPPI
jgi:hypothetical protein